MKMIVFQPKLEQEMKQLENLLQQHSYVDMVLFPEGYLNEHVERAARLARRTGTILIGGYRNPHARPKDRAVLIDRAGTIAVDRIKYSPTSIAAVEGLSIGHLLCDELILQGLTSEEAVPPDLLVHPIGVGMFSEEQFEEWINAAREIAIAHRTMIVGTSHADGSYRDSDVSIPIAYCFDERGEAVFVSKRDVRARILDLETKEVTILD